MRRLAVFAVTSILVACAAPPREADSTAAVPTPAAPEVETKVHEQVKQAAVESRRRAERATLTDMAAGAAAQPIGNMMAPPSAPVMNESYQAADALGPGRYAPMIQDGEKYAHFDDSGVLRVAEVPVSTFSIDVDTGSYSNLRRMLRDGSLPRQDAVRIEEMINYFDYGYAPPRDQGTPFAVHTQLAPTPWNAKTQLMRIGLQGWKTTSGELPPSNLVFLVDVSGSMQSPDKLPLVKNSLRLLVNELTARDRISLAVYAGAAGAVLPPTPGSEKGKIISAIEALEAGGSTNGAQGIQLAYSLAQQAYIRGGINRVLIATDGDFNVGTVDFEQLKDLVEEKRKSGVALSTLGFGTGNYNDQLMEQLADAGNYTYVDGLQEARRALVEMRGATLQTLAKDVKIQLEFNPAVVSEYRLIGYENRALKREDFNNDQVDAGEIGAGHSVTALYEIALKGSGGERMDALRYGSGEGKIDGNAEIAWLKLRYKAPEGDTSKLIERAITKADGVGSFAQADESLRFAASVSAFGQILRGGKYTGAYSYGDVLKTARSAKGSDAQGWKGEFVQLVELAQSLGTQAAMKHEEGTD